MMDCKQRCSEAELQLSSVSLGYGCPKGEGKVYRVRFVSATSLLKGSTNRNGIG